MAEHAQRTPRSKDDDEATPSPSSPAHPTPDPKAGPRPASELAAAVKALDQELTRQARQYEDAHTAHQALGGTMAQVLEEMAGLEARRTALADEIGRLEARLVSLRADVAQADVAQAETPA